ncbi:DUF5597 domain-containing protein [candidate division KSB1 bacterium]|nr:DUF5597 domain-containing protein [candidate division KSB1 bacterium]
MKSPSFLLLLLFVSITGCPYLVRSQNQNNLPHFVKSEEKTQLIVNGLPFLLLAGEVHNSSSSSLDYMEESVWPELVSLNCNTAIVTVSWELFEPNEGQYDTQLIDGLIFGARKHNLKLVVIWFGTWKNAWSTYVPGWVKQDTKRFPRARTKGGESMGTLSAFSEASCAADARAYAELLRRIREIDAKEQTIILMQVENETGILTTDRDYSPLANAAFGENVPEELTAYLTKNKSTLHPEMKLLWEKTGYQTSGTWTHVFGDHAAEVFMAWHTAAYLEKVAAAGKREYPLPMFANAWLVQFAGQEAGNYPSGGPVSRMHDVWRCAAPSLDAFAPDIYIQDFLGVCDDYSRNNNPLIIPEARRDGVSIANMFYAFGEKDALCFAPFGIESMVAKGALEGDMPWFGQMSQSDGQRFAQCYKILNDMMPILTRYQGTDQMIGFVQGKEESIERDLGRYRIHITFTGSTEIGQVPGGGLVIAESPDDFILVGQQFSFRFQQGKGSAKHVDYLEHTEGVYQNGQWLPGRRLNGDEYYVPLEINPHVRKVRLYSYD